jgi:transcriptional regulator of arginine metabolism
VVASALDRAGLPGIIGTVAGDDTLMVIAESVAAGSRVGANLRELAGL